MAYMDTRYIVRYIKGNHEWVWSLDYDGYHRLIARLASEHIAYMVEEIME